MALALPYEYHSIIMYHPPFLRVNFLCLPGVKLPNVGPNLEYLMIVENCEERIRHVCNQCIDIDTRMHYIKGIYIYIFIYALIERERMRHTSIYVYMS